jgi:MFS superfamily sulfate permease-like transporter
MPTILLTFASFLATATLFPLAVILLACGWPWLLDRIIGDRERRQLLHGIAMVAGAAAGLFLHRRVLQFDDELLGGGIVWFIAITLGVLAYGLSTIVLGIHRQTQREKSRG